MSKNQDNIFITYEYTFLSLIKNEQTKEKNR